MRTKNFVDHVIIAGLAIAVVSVSMLWTSARWHVEDATLAHASYKAPLVIESDTLPVVFLDTEGVIVDMSPSAERLLGWADAVGQTAAALMPPVGGADHQHALKNSTMQPGEGRLVKCMVEVGGEPTEIVLLIMAYTVSDYMGYAAIIWEPSDFNSRIFREDK